MVLGEAAVYISLCTLSENSGFICVPLDLFVPGGFLQTANQLPHRRCGERGWLQWPVPRCLVSSQLFCSSFRRETQGFKLGRFPGAQRCREQEVTGSGEGGTHCPPGSLPPPPTGYVWVLCSSASCSSGTLQQGEKSEVFFTFSDCLNIYIFLILIFLCLGSL